MLPARLKKLLILIPLAMLTLGNTDCSAPKLDWHGTIYVGDSTEQAIVGKKDNVPIVVKCNDPFLDKMVCTDSFAELQHAYKDQLAKCQKWGP